MTTTTMIFSQKIYSLWLIWGNGNYRHVPHSLFLSPSAIFPLLFLFITILKVRREGKCREKSFSGSFPALLHPSHAINCPIDSVRTGQDQYLGFSEWACRKRRAFFSLMADRENKGEDEGKKKTSLSACLSYGL